MTTVKHESDYVSLYDGACERIQQLEALNAVLAAEIDRMRSVVEAAQATVSPDLIHASLLQLNKSVKIYEAQMAQLAKEG